MTCRVLIISFIETSDLMMAVDGRNRRDPHLDIPHPWACFKEMLEVRMIEA